MNLVFLSVITLTITFYWWWVVPVGLILCFILILSGISDLLAVLAGAVASCLLTWGIFSWLADAHLFG